MQEEFVLEETEAGWRFAMYIEGELRSATYYASFADAVAAAKQRVTETE